jgi:hypothetical protein
MGCEVGLGLDFCFCLFPIRHILRSCLFFPLCSVMREGIHGLIHVTLPCASRLAYVPRLVCEERIWVSL